uniref:JmjC domain-containing protein n=1 Tax=Globodera rostochiensis TaxID=31243 RepID=A0A914IAF4_GLORO
MDGTKDVEDEKQQQKSSPLSIDTNCLTASVDQPSNSHSASSTSTTTSSCSPVASASAIDCMRMSRASGDGQHATSTCAHCGRENATNSDFAESSSSNLLLLLHGGSLPSQEAKLIRKRDLARQASGGQGALSAPDDEPSVAEWIFCDLCRKWFHCVCVDVQDYEVPLIDKFHCTSCRFEHGNSIMKVARLAHRYAFDDESERELPEQVGTEQWIRHFRERCHEHPEAPQPSAFQVFENGAELMANFAFEKCWDRPIKVRNPRGLGLSMPDDPYFDVLDVIRLLSNTVTVDTIDVYAQRSYTMSLGRFYDMWRKRVRDRLYNILSLEFSGTKLGKIVRPPSLVRALSWVQKFWPDDNCNNRDDDNDNNCLVEHVEQQQQQQHHQRECLRAENGDGNRHGQAGGAVTAAQPMHNTDPYEFANKPAQPSLSSSSSLLLSSNDVNGSTKQQQRMAAAAHQSSRPFVENFCLMGMRGSYTDFHIDFGGSSVWYHVFRGEKVFFVARPTAPNLAEFLRWQRMDGRKRSETFFGDCLAPGEQLYRVHVRERETLFLPSGWIHAVLTPEDSLVFGGNFLHSLNVPMQIKIYEMELAAETDERFKFPFFELCNFYAAKNIAETLKDHTAEGIVAAQLQLDAAKALRDKCKEWLQLSGDKFAVLGGNLRLLERELGRQRCLRRRICERALLTATVAMSNDTSASTSASGSPCPTTTPLQLLSTEAGEGYKLDAQDLLDRSFAVEDEEDEYLEDEEAEEEEQKGGEDGWDGRRTTTEEDDDDEVEGEEEEELAQTKQRKKQRRRRRRTITDQQQQQTAVLEIESTGPVKLKIKLPCWRGVLSSTVKDGGEQSCSSSSSVQQQFSVKRSWEKKKHFAVTEEEEETPTLDVGAMFSGKSTHGRRLRPTVRISESATALDAQSFSTVNDAFDAASSSFAKAGCNNNSGDNDYEEPAKKMKGAAAAGIETKAFLAQFTAEERRLIESAERAAELDCRGALFSPIPPSKKKLSNNKKHLVKKDEKEAPNAQPPATAAARLAKVPKRPPMNAQQRIAKKLGLMRKK